MTEVYQPNAPSRWPGFKYVQVPGYANRLIARWLRTQRKNMREFFRQRGLTDLVLRMDDIRNSRQGMLAKNRMFQKVLDDYAKLVNPGAAPQSAAEAPDQHPVSALDPSPADAVAVQAADAVDGATGSGDGVHPGDGVPELAGEDGGADGQLSVPLTQDGFVVEE